MNLKSHKMQASGVLGAIASAFSVSAQAGMTNGIVDAWTVDVNTIFDTGLDSATVMVRAPAATGVQVVSSRACVGATQRRADSTHRFPSRRR